MAMNITAMMVLPIFAKYKKMHLSCQFVTEMVVKRPEFVIERQYYKDGELDWTPKMITHQLQADHKEELTKVLGKFCEKKFVKTVSLKKDAKFLRKVMFSDLKEIKTNKIVYTITDFGMQYYKLSMIQDK